MQFLLRTNLLVMNRRRKPTFVNAIWKECLDVTLATFGVSDLLDSWRVMDDETFSDLRLIKFSLKGQGKLSFQEILQEP